MTVLIRQATLIDPRSAHHGRELDVLLKSGKIAETGNITALADTVIEAKGMFLSPGWLDMRADFCDPGYEFKEDLHSGARAALRGGFAGVALMPDTKPVIQSKESIHYLLRKAADTGITLYPLAAATAGLEGTDMTEMVDLMRAGAVAFANGAAKGTLKSNVTLKLLQYLRPHGALLIVRPEDAALSEHGLMNEGKVSAFLGLPGLPALAEDVVVMRDLELLRYSGGRIHFSGVSSPESLKLIKKAKAEGLGVTCDVAAYQLVYDDSYLTDFDSNHKVKPPYRSAKDIKALLKGLEDGVIDAIVSDHKPQDEESKNLEFDQAEFGSAGIQTVYSLLVKAGLSPELVVEKLALAPARILGVPVPQVQPGEDAVLTLFDPNAQWEVNPENWASKSRNNPAWGQQLKGRAMAVFNKQKYYIASLIVKKV